MKVNELIFQLYVLTLKPLKKVTFMDSYWQELENSQNSGYKETKKIGTSYTTITR